MIHSLPHVGDIVNDGSEQMQRVVKVTHVSDANSTCIKIICEPITATSGMKVPTSLRDVTK